jgi:phosphoribosylformylglycinamidine synthase subunit PurS
LFRAEVFVTLKPVVNDPVGLTIMSGLRSLGFESVSEVRSGKYLQLTIDEKDREAAKRSVEEMCRRLLANSVIEDYRIDLEAIETTAAREVAVKSGSRS